jgi:hypothetical protein
MRSKGATHVNTQAPARRLSPEERQRRFIESAERYMRGEIKPDEYERAERRYMPDYEAIVRSLVGSRTLQRMWEFFARRT